MDGLMGAIIVPVLLLLVLLEYLISRRRGMDNYQFSDTVVNMLCGTLERLFDLFWIVLMFWAFEKIDAAIPWSIPSTPLTWVLALMAADFLAYWHHRLSHEINVFWAGHIVHHQSEELNVTTVFRVSAFSVINRTFFFIWMPVFGFEPQFATSAIVAVGLFQFVTHTRLVGKLGFIEKIFVTPSHHRVHHARNEKYLDKNYGHVFIIWDKMFGTFIEEDEEPDYGITTGFDSANPYEAYLFYWKDLFRRARETKDWRDKVRVFIMPPSWSPKDATPTPPQYKTSPDGKRLKQRYDVPVPLQLYTFLHALLTVGIFVILKQKEKGIIEFSSLQVTVMTIMIAVSALSVGLLMERRNRGLWLEYFRLPFLGVCTAFLLWNTSFAWIAIPAAGALLLLSLVWIVRMRAHFGIATEKKTPELAA
ncbi:MAG: sterol desaturase family protein [Bacteroidetes bacterium]|nr:MAG: sterol desaturase family protein [Bacteroidota bacterium]